MLEKKPKIALCAAFEAGVLISEFMAKHHYPIQFVATCNKDKEETETKIAKIWQDKGVQIHRRVDINSDEFTKFVKDNNIDIVILAWWPDILKKKIIESAKIGFINLHTSFLPYNQGKHPYYWAIVEGTDFGVTLHFVDEGIDSGPILFQKKIPVDITDTGETLWYKSWKGVIELFKESYDKITNLDFVPIPQENDVATFHLAKMLDPHSRIDLNKTYKANDLINRIRGRTFLKGESSYFFYNGKKYWIKTIIEEEK